jgi:hypothetical protein
VSGATGPAFLGGTDRTTPKTPVRSSVICITAVFRPSQLYLRSGATNPIFYIRRDFHFLWDTPQVKRICRGYNKLYNNEPFSDTRKYTLPERERPLLYELDTNHTPRSPLESAQATS